MRMSHACAGCGSDLTRLRALPDPHYGLPIVVCAGCGAGVVRRRAWTRRAAKWHRAFRRSINMLTLRAWVLFLLTLAMYVSSGFMAETALDWRSAAAGAWRSAPGVLFDAAWKDGLLALAASAVFAGAWVSAVSAHWGQRPAIGAVRGITAWLVIVAALVMAPAAVWLIAEPFSAWTGAGWRYGGPTREEWSMQLLMALLSAPLSVGVGMPLGLTLERSGEWRRMRRWRKLLVKMRSRRGQTC